MKRFITQILLFTIVPILFMIITSYYFADGYIDTYYKRFTSSKQEHLILGTSRAAQGIVPSVLNKNFQKQFYNYSFTISHSPFGKGYFESIKKKLDPHTKNGIFIIAVDPFSITSHLKPNGDENFDHEKMITNQKMVNTNPNFEYIFKNHLAPWRLLFNHKKKNKKNITYLHDDGWLEVDYPWTAEKYAINLESKIKDYRKNQMKRVVSKVRIHYLEETIKFLKQHGTVYLVRIPTAKEMFDIENELVPQFNTIIHELATRNRVNYFNCSQDYNIYQTTDGNHLYKPYAYKFTEALCDSILMKH